MISAPTAVTEFTGSHNAAPADFPQSYHAIEPVLLSRADNIRPYGGDRIYRFSQRSSGGFFRSHITAIKPVRISRADDIRPYGGDRIHRFSQCGSGGFFRNHITAVISAQSRTEKNLSEQGAGFRARGRVLCVRNRANGFLQRSYGKLFPQSDHSISDMAMALILTV